MWRSSAGCCALMLAVSLPAFAQSYDELQRENQQLRVRLRELEAAVAKHGHDHKEDHADKEGHSHEHEEPGERVCEAHWRWEDPRYPGWCRPVDEYRPGSWMAPPSQGFCRDLFCGDFVETHRSTYCTPWVHPFTIEPAQIHRDAFFFYKFSKDAEGGPTDEHENEFHLDWGLTRRFGFTVAVPFLGLVGPEEHLPPASATSNLRRELSSSNRRSSFSPATSS
jgi:hypothetical protein